MNKNQKKLKAERAQTKGKDGSKDWDTMTMCSRNRNIVHVTQSNSSKFE